MNGVVGRGGRSPGRIFYRRYKGLAAGVAVVLLVFVGAAKWLLIDRRIVAESEHQAVALARGISSYELAGLLVRSSQSGRMQLDDEEAADLRARLSRFMPHFGLREIRLLDRDGRTVFCDLIGPPHALLLTSEELQAVSTVIAGPSSPNV